MAALLRSARLLKFSPSGLLRIPGTRRSGPLLDRLYSSAVGGRRTEICSRQLSRISDSVSRNVWPYAAGCVRSYALASEVSDESDVALRFNQVRQFEWALNKLDNSVRTTGCITKSMLLDNFHVTCRKGCPSGNMALLLLRSCGSLLAEVPVEERNELAHQVWDKLQELGAQYDVSHYNALLKVYLQNDFRFSPTDFLAKMEAANIQPNRVTYQRFIAAYCQTGDIEGASTILGFMKSKDLPITEAVFSSLVTGHARAGDIDSAVNILSVMREAGIKQGSATYLSLLNAYAERGDLDGMKKTLEEAKRADCVLFDNDIMQVISTLAKAGHQQHVPVMIEQLRCDSGFIPDAINLCQSLITQGQEDVAFSVVKTFPSLKLDASFNIKSFFLRKCINMNMPLEKVVFYCKEFKEMKFQSEPLNFALRCALEANKTAMALELMERMKEQNLPIRVPYFWPLLSHQLKENNVAGMLEVVKRMEKLGMTLDDRTLTSYIVPLFPNIEAAYQALKNVGISVETSFLLNYVRTLAENDIAKLYTLLSDPSLPSLELSSFYVSLINSFKKFSDMENMVKIFELLYKDQRFCSEKMNPADSTAFLLYKMIANMTIMELQEQKTKLKDLLNQLKAKNLTISIQSYKGFKRVLELSHISELVEDVFALVEPMQKRLYGIAPYRISLDEVENVVLELEKKIDERKAENKPYSYLLKQAITSLSVKEDLQHALELKLQHKQEMTPWTYAILISLCCRHNNTEEVLNLKREMNLLDASFVLDPINYIILVKTLALNGKVEEAVDILKEMKEKNVVLMDAHIDSLTDLLSAVLSKDIMAAVRLQETIFSLGLAKPRTSLCSPFVTAYLSSNDLAGALDAAIQCYKLSNFLPHLHDLFVALLEKGNTDLLQKAMDFAKQEKGEVAMLYDLFFAYLDSSRYDDARRIIETPGLRAKPARLQWFAEKCIHYKQVETLDEMVEMTAKLFGSDRDEMYSYVLRLCKETNDWKKAEATWTKMQDENVIPRERTLCLLADILKHNGQEVPFDVPELWYNEAINTAQQVSYPKEKDRVDLAVELRRLCQMNQGNEAFELLKVWDPKGVVLPLRTYDEVICSLVREGFIEDAFIVKEIAQSKIPDFKLSSMANNCLIVSYSLKGQVTNALDVLKSMLKSNYLPTAMTITKLVQALGNRGDVTGIEKVESLIKTSGSTMNLTSMLFVNNMAIAHINNGDFDSAVELLEEIYMHPKSSHPSMRYVFRKVLESGNDKALDKLSAMAVQLADNIACNRPATDLFLELLEMNKVEEAKAVLDRCTGVAEQKKALLSFLAKVTRKPGAIEKIKALTNLLPDFADKTVLNSFMLKAYVLDENLPMAKDIYEQCVKEGIALDELSLKRLAVCYRQAGDIAPFPEPPETFKFYANKLIRKTEIQETAEE